VRQRVLFKLPVLVFQCQTDQAPSYLADDCQLNSDVHPRRLRSSDSVTCVVRRTRNTYSDRCFAAAGPRVWNSLPAELRRCDSLRQFKRRLKTNLFGIWDHGALWLLVRQRRIEIALLTYLLSSHMCDTWEWEISRDVLQLVVSDESWHEQTLIAEQQSECRLHRSRWDLVSIINAAIVLLCRWRFLHSTQPLLRMSRHLTVGKIPQQPQREMYNLYCGNSSLILSPLSVRVTCRMVLPQ